MKKMWVILILAITLRLFLAFSTFHPDIQTFNLAGKVVSSGNILNLYDFLPSLSDDNPIKNTAVFNYPPAIYFFHGVFNFLFNLLGLPVNQFLQDFPSNYGNMLFNLHLLLLKIPYLIFDLLTGFILFKLFSDKKKQELALILWLFNPINLYASYMMGQFDIIPTFFALLSIYFVAKNKLNLAAISLGVGIAFKLYPLFLVVPLIILGRNFQERIKLIILSLVPYFATMLPYLPSHNFRSVALFTNQSSKSLYAQISVSGGESIIIFPALLIVFYLIIFTSREKFITWKIYSIPLFLFFIFTHFHPQWLIWLTPFFILEVVSNRYKNTLAISLIFISFLGSLFFFDPSLTIGLFAPIFPSLHSTMSIWEIMNIKIDYNYSRSLLQTIFAGSLTYLIYQYFPRRVPDED